MDAVLTPELLLKEKFGYDRFREGQREIIEQILNGGDLLAVMPTGAGKSICYQIPALLLPGLTLVVSPLISLMKDQVGALCQNGVPAAYYNSSLTAGQRGRVLANAAQGRYRILYVAPERLASEQFRAFAAGADVPLVAVDEAHCVSQWGQDFRPAYLDIPPFIQSLPRRPVVAAFTATATNRVGEDIVRMLGLQNPLFRKTGFDRPNLYFEVRQRAERDKTAELLKILQDAPGKSAIIYCSSRKKTEELAQTLQSQGYGAACYHAGLSDEQRRRAQDDFIYDRTPVIVATNAFGMGIDKPNVSLVVHYNMPKNLENYYQEAGRAGRDGDPARCILLYSAKDVSTARYFIETNDNEKLDEKQREEVKRQDYQNLSRMVRYCTGTGCLRRQILSYFGEETGDCGHCGNCEGEFVQVDATVPTQMILSCICRMDQRFGAALVCDVLRGAKTQRLQSLGFDRLSTYGLMKGRKAREIGDDIDQLEEQGLLRRTDDDYHILKLTKAGAEVLKGQRAVQFRKQKEIARKKSAQAAPENPELYELLRQWRTQTAKEMGVPPYFIFSDRTLRAVSAAQPATSEQLLELPGIGQHKLQDFGEQLLKLIFDWQNGGH